MANPASADRIRLVVLFGGASAEHDVSCVTAAHVLAAADRSKYELIPVGITRDGTWIRNDKAIATLADPNLSLPDALEPEGTEIDPLSALQRAGDATVVVLPLLHGPHGEDGTVQGMLELAGVPYAGAGVLGSALCMDKAMAKVVTAQSQIPQCKWIEFQAGSGEIDQLIERAVDTLGLPVFVKPANLGSSVGISKAHDRTELATAIELALRYDEVLVIEEAVDAREIEVAVLGNRDPRSSVPGEIVPGAEFYDYEDKYVSGAAGLVIPADLSDHEVAEVRQLAKRAFLALRCAGMARVDFFYEENGRGWLLNEINTIPGFTSISMYPKLWEASGLGYSDLIDRLVELARERHQVRSGFSTDH